MNDAFLHAFNIALHVATGLAVLLLGLWQLAAPHGDKAHRRRGRWVLALAGVSVASAAVGALVFRPKPDLLAVCLLVAYQLYSGRRCLRLPRNGRAPADWLPALALGLAALALLAPAGNFAWEPERVRAIAGAMLFFAIYDLARTRFPAQWRRGLNPAEHALRLCAMVGAMASVAAAQQLPAGLAVQVSLGVSAGFSMLGALLAWRAVRQALGVQPSLILKARLKADSEL